MPLRARLASIVCLIALIATPAGASPDALVDAIEAWDVRGLQDAARQATDRGPRQLALAVLDVFAGRDAVAIDSLETLTASGHLEGALRFVAFRELGRVDLRNQRYGRAARAFEGALASVGEIASARRDEVEDDLRYARANLAILPMTATGKPGASVALVRDSMDLPRAGVEINGSRDDAILDTGASNSVVSRATA